MHIPDTKHNPMLTVCIKMHQRGTAVTQRSREPQDESVQQFLARGHLSEESLLETHKGLVLLVLVVA